MNEEQQAAQDKLQIAIEEHVRAFRSSMQVGDVEVVGDWVLVAAVAGIDLETQERRYAYNLGFSGGELPEHVAIGLLRRATRLVELGERLED